MGWNTLDSVSAEVTNSLKTLSQEKSKKGLKNMNEVVTINGNDLQVKMWNGQRIVSFKDVDRVHDRAEGTAHRNFKENKKHLIENEDYFVLKPADVLKDEFRPLGFDNEKPANRGTTYLTESGYLLLVKSFTDDLAWNVQRQLVNSYFKFREVMETIQPTENGLMLSDAKFTEALDTITSCAAVFKNMIDYSTINYKQQQDLLQTARKRVNTLLGGAHSPEYKEYSRIYFKNLWQDFCKAFDCGSYKDLNPLYMADDIAKKWIQNWEYTEA